MANENGGSYLRVWARCGRRVPPRPGRLPLRPTQRAICLCPNILNEHVGLQAFSSCSDFQSSKRSFPPTRHPSIRPNPTCPVADGPPSDRTYNIRKRAFDAIDVQNSAVARHLMRCAIDDDPSDKIALRQEVYLDLDAGDGPGAIGDIDALRGLGASDAQLEAQEGYIYAEKKNYREAKAAFRRAIETGDPDIRLQSFQALRNIGSEGSPRSLDLEIDSEYLHRFDDGIVDATARFYQRIGKASPVQAYLNLRLLRDTASDVGPAAADHRRQRLPDGDWAAVSAARCTLCDQRRS